MLVTIYHDPYGKPVVVVSRSEGACPAQEILQPPHGTIEVDVPELTRDIADDGFPAQVLEVMRTRRVDPEGGRLLVNDEQAPVPTKSGD